jgi:hypothetical protein
MSRVRTVKKKIERQISFFDLLIPSYLVFCEDYIISQTNNLSLLKTIDMLKADQLPYSPVRFVLVATFLRNPDADIALFAELSPQLTVTLVNPAGAEFDLGTYPVSHLNPDKPWAVERLIIEFEQENISFNSPGGYSFRIAGKIGDSVVPAHYRLLPVLLKKRREFGATKQDFANS